MEKFSQFRDKGTAIAPFLPVPSPTASILWTPVHVFLFLVRAPAVLFLSFFYFALLEWLPVGSSVKKCVLWLLLAIPGVWWVDLQVDGVRRGQLHSAKGNLPKAGTIIASSFTSPLDPLYLAGIFCPVFTRSFPYTRQVEKISLLRAILLAFSAPQLEPSDPSRLVTLKYLTEKYPKSIICVFPECTTTNGRGILPFSPSLLTAGESTKIYPVNLRYTPQDITTPIPGGLFTWFWKLLSKPSHCMRVRIATRVYNNRSLDTPNGKNAAATGFDTNIFDRPDLRNGISHDNWGDEGDEDDKDVTGEEKKVLDRVGEDLARLGRVKRVGLGLKDKIAFLKLWQRRMGR